MDGACPEVLALVLLPQVPEVADLPIGRMKRARVRNITSAIGYGDRNVKLHP